MTKTGRPRHPEDLKGVRITLTQPQIDHGKSVPGGLSALARDLLDAHRTETPTSDTVLRVLRAAVAAGVVDERADLEVSVELVLEHLGRAGPTPEPDPEPEPGGIEAWYVTDHAIESACDILGFDPDDEEHWDYVARLVEGLAQVAKLKGPDRETDGEVWQVGQPHKRLRMLVSRAERPEGPLPQVLDVWRPHARWRRPREPMWLPIPGEEH